MRIARSALAFLLVAVIAIAFMPVAGQANAASKKTVYLVKSVKIKENGKTYTAKMSYNKDGLLTKLVNPSEGALLTFTYGKNGEIKTATQKVTSGKMKGYTEKATYTWKDGKMVKKTGTRSEPGSPGDDSFTYTMIYKGDKVVKSRNTEEYINEEGKQESNTHDTNYTYKGGKVVKAEGNFLTTFKYDKKGNLLESKVTIKLKDGTVMTPGFYKAKITYKNKRVHKMKVSYKNGMMDKAVKSNQTYSYKKVKVSKSVADKVAAQQWRLANDTVIDGIPW